MSLVAGFLQFCLRFAGFDPALAHTKPIETPPIEIPIEEEETEILEVAEIADEIIASIPLYPDKIICPERGYVFLGNEMHHDFYAGTEVPHPHGGFYPTSLVVIGMNDFFLTGWAALASDYAINGKKLLAICWRKARQQNIVGENPRGPYTRGPMTPEKVYEMVKYKAPEPEISEEDAFFREILPDKKS